MMRSGGNNMIRGNIIWLDVAGKVALGNAQDGIQCGPGSDNTTIANNTVSGNLDWGVVLFSRNNIVRGNIIGLDVTGKVALGNALDGIQCGLGSDNMTIANNTVCGNLLIGMVLLRRHKVVHGNNRPLYTSYAGEKYRCVNLIGAGNKNKRKKIARR